MEKVVIEKLSRPDAADLITAPGKSIDIAGLRAELTQTERRRAKMARIEEQLAE